jgi:probable F420-dependent oxidoreductase
MKIGAFVPLGTMNASASFLRALGPALEERGFESVWVPEHVVLFDEYESHYPYAADGRFPGGGDSGLLEPLTALGYLAAVTDSLRLGTGICLVPQRNPVYTAKQVADVDVLSGGRVEFGVGIGWLREEFDVLGMPFERRGERAREYIEVMKTLWSDEVSSYEGEHYRLPECRLYPKPAQQPHPPVIFGGESDAAMRRVADLGDGWYGFNRTPDEVPEALERLDRILEERGRSRRDIEVSICPYFKSVDLAALKQYAELGVDRVIIVVLGFDADGLMGTLDTMATELVEPAAAL